MRVEFTPDPGLYPFTSKWFDSTPGRMHYVDEGSGAPILLCHGNPTWSFLYRDIIKLLRDRFRCIAPDYLGFGMSDRPDGFGYTIDEHAHVVGELADHLNLDGYLTMGQDWGGPVSMAVDTARADRVRRVVLGNTWFWPFDEISMKVFSMVMSSRPMQRAILDRNFFVERLIPAGTATKLSGAVMDHYRAVQPSAPARSGVARVPKELLAARPLLERLAREVPRTLGSKPALLVWGMKDQSRVSAGPQRSQDARGLSRPRPHRAARRQALHPGGCAGPDRRVDHPALRLMGLLGERLHRRAGAHQVAVPVRAVDAAHRRPHLRPELLA
jgi:haloalkane dehalogenase